MSDAINAAAASTNVDAIYYEAGGDGTIAQRIGEFARRSVYTGLVNALRPTESTTLLDVGVSDVETTAANIIEKLHPYPHRITAAGIGNGEAFARRYPTAKFVPITQGAKLPFPDKHFDIACSNAVLEHVGGAAERAAFICELDRVALNIYITIPNRWFPIEHHTAIPLLHYYPPLFRWCCERTVQRHWSKKSELDFLGKSEILKEWPLKKPPQIKFIGLPLGPWSSNLAIIA